MLIAERRAALLAWREMQKRDRVVAYIIADAICAAKPPPYNAVGRAVDFYML